MAPGDAVPDQLVEAVKTQMQQQAPPGKQVKVDDGGFQQIELMKKGGQRIS